MTPELWQRLKPLFHAALDCNVEQRAAFISDACGTDAELKENLEKLLQAAGESTRAFDGPILQLSAYSDVRFQSGETLLGRFRIIRPIGRGGMGEVFEAEDLQLGRIALKTIRGGIASSPDVLNRFRQEVQLARKISGSRVCRIHELYLLPANNGFPPTAFLTMEYLDGITLAEKLKRDGPFSLPDALQIALDICEGLHLIHENGVIHRDMKSANVMLCSRGNESSRAVLMDFGLARNLDAAINIAGGPTADLEMGTAAGVVMGTPAYMAPEQFEAKAVSPATDFYALGIVLYELLTGIHPYAAATPVGAAIRRARRRDPISSVQRRIPRHWDAIVEKCLQYDPEKRFQSSEEVAKALRAGPLNVTNIAIDHPWLVRIAGAFLLATAAFGIVAWWHYGQYYQPNADEQRWYEAGLTALREASYLKATRALETATAKDQRYTMAHARLAEAWANLDFDERAQQEMLIASSGENRLPSLDHMYLNAIRATLTHDFRGSIDLYSKILAKLPATEKAAGYVDLGMAYEKAGDPQRALDYYGKSSSLNPDNPAPWLRAGMVETRLNRMTEANQAFSRAEALYAAEMNPEGQAELDDQRGYMASLSGHVTEAETYLHRSIDEAQRIASIQLQIRALTQLSSIECAYGDLSAAVTHASEAIQFARDHQQDAWAAMGLARLAHARLTQGNAHFVEAETAVNEARSLAVQTQQGRALALANLVLASLRDQQERPDEVVQPASDALAYYRQNGYFEPAAAATLLLLRAEASRGDLHELLARSQAFLSLAENSGSPALRAEAEHNLGNAYSEMESYPDALVHYQRAAELAGTDLDRIYEQIELAALLAKLGRFEESRKMLVPAAANNATQPHVAAVEVDAQLMQAHYLSALEKTQVALLSNRDMTQSEARTFKRRQAIAEAHLGRAAQALQDIANALPADPQNKSALRSALLQQAEVELLAGQPESALTSAKKLLQEFKEQEQLDSALRSALLAAAASHFVKNDSDRDNFSQQAVDILSDLKHTWRDNSLQPYLARPDTRLILHSAILPNWPSSK
jgi:tetratricopeptide (TPR) repeat protein